MLGSAGGERIGATPVDSARISVAASSAISEGGNDTGGDVGLRRPCVSNMIRRDCTKAGAQCHKEKKEKGMRNPDQMKYLYLEKNEQEERDKIPSRDGMA